MVYVTVWFFSALGCMVGTLQISIIINNNNNNRHFYSAVSHWRGQAHRTLQGPQKWTQKTLEIIYYNNILLTHHTHSHIRARRYVIWSTWLSSNLPSQPLFTLTSLLSCCLTSMEARWPIRDGDRVGRGRESERLNRWNRPKKTVDRLQNNGSVKEVSPRHCPATCALCNCSFNCCAGQSH